MIDLELAKLDPSSVFKNPWNVLNENTLTREQKIDILRRWSYDEREILVAEEENMLDFNNQQSVLHDILKCLLELGIEDDEERHPPTKQG
jgi:hypothetical protein